MDTVWRGLVQGMRLLLSGDPYVWDVILRTAKVAGAALTAASLLGVPLGALLGLTRFPGRRLVQTLIYTGMGIPPVLAGLAVYLLLSRNGILGPLGLPWMPKLFTPAAMVLAQVFIATPLVAGFTMAAVEGVDPDLQRQVRALGATRLQVAWTVLREARLGLVVALMAGLGRVVSEVGAVMLVGGNIEGSTRVLTTAILLETRKGNFDLALGLGLILLLLAGGVNLLAIQLQGREGIWG